MEDLEEIANESRINFVPCLKWVKRGVAKATPEKVQLTKEELIEAINKAKSDLQEANNAQESQDENDMTVDDEFNLENYDEETETTLEQFALHNVIQAPTEEDHFSDDDSDKEDDIIKTEDNLILVGRVDGDASILEVYIQNESEDSLYCHHDVFLPAFPLCIEWLDFEPGHPSGNYCAIGSMKPTIDIWDLDIENCLEPAYILGQKASRKKGLPHIGHTDAVLDISWNTNYHHVLASGSVDETILLWDIDEGKPSSKIEVFKEKVQCVKWHKLEGYTLLTGGCDKTARVFDCRSIDAFLKWDLSGEAERVAWSPLEPFVFFVGTNVGKIHAIDCRRGELWSLQAHEKEVTGMTISGQCPGLLVTASMDEKLKVWDFSAETVPSLVFEKDYALGNMHCLELCPDSPFIVAVGGDNKTHNFKVVDLQKIEEVNNRFGSRPLIKLELESEGQSST